MNWSQNCHKKYHKIILKMTYEGITKMNDYNMIVKMITIWSDHKIIIKNDHIFLGIDGWYTRFFFQIRQLEFSDLSSSNYLVTLSDSREKNCVVFYSILNFVVFVKNWNLKIRRCAYATLRLSGSSISLKLQTVTGWAL